MADGMRGWPRFVRATRVSYAGLGWALRNEEAFRLEVVAAVCMAPLGLWFAHSALERAVLMFSLVFVLVVELLNTAVEVAIDRIGPERHALSGLAKDLGSAAVHLSLLQVPLVWSIVLFC